MGGAVAYISLDSIRANLQAIRRRAGRGVSLCPAVKADAYGHGLALVLPVLADEGVEQVAVAGLAEALEARRLGWTGGILCFGAPLAGDSAAAEREHAETAVRAGVACTVSHPGELAAMARAAQRLGRPAGVHVKVDTGMGRMGLLPEAAEEFILQAARQPGVRLAGVYTHFATADEPDPAFARRQLACFQSLIAKLRTAGLADGVLFHCANSAALFRMPEARLDMVRPGLSLYGYWQEGGGPRPADLRPAMRVVSRLTAVRALPAGHGVGYGRSFVTARPSLIGVVPIGYGDGYRRGLGSRAVMSLEPVRDQARRIVPVVGRISMDQTTVDLTDAGDARVGDPVTVVDDNPASPHGVEALARLLDTIPYEVTCLITSRVPRRPAEETPR